MTRNPTVTIDGEWLLARIQQIEYIIDDVRAACASGAFMVGADQTKPSSKRRTQDGIPVSPRTTNALFDISEIEWKTKGSEPARVDDSWAWAFAYDRDGIVLPETQAILTELLHKDKVQVGIYEITLSGQDKKLLSRKIPKSKGRKGR